MKTDYQKFAGKLPYASELHGIYQPLLSDPKDAVKNAFEVFDQWIELLPTDQIVPVEVAYDPKTGMQV